ncbi:MAG TPA: tetratricopeptide repeat protein, partial [Acidimicrobiia bacterium]|nr:tetratricopeptide repeat protein [Acidimicrobiia bacterium]
MQTNGAYDDFQAGLGLLKEDNFHAAAVALERARAVEPDKGSIREALGRAYFRARRFRAARDEFARTIELNPSSDYGHFALGLCLIRLGDFEGARGHLR